MFTIHAPNQCVITKELGFQRLKLDWDAQWRTTLRFHGVIFIGKAARHWL